MQDIREAASKLRDSKLKRLNLVAPALKHIMSDLGLSHQEEAIAFVALLDRQCGCKYSDLDDLSSYLSITSLDVMSFVPALNSLIHAGYVTVENRSEQMLTRKRFLICPEVFYALIEGKEVKPIAITEEDEFDQFDFCAAIDKLKEERRNKSIETTKLFNRTLSMEEDYADMPMVAQLRQLVSDVEARMLFYEMAYDFTQDSDGGHSCINQTLDDIYDRILSKARAKRALMEGTHPLIVNELIEISEDDEMRLTNEGITLLFGKEAPFMVNKNHCADRFQFVTMLSEFINDMHTNPGEREQASLHRKLYAMEKENKHLPFVERLACILNSIYDRIIFYMVCKEMIDDETYSLWQLRNILDKSQEMKLRRIFKDGKSELQKHGLVEMASESMADRSEIVLSDKGKELFLEQDMAIFEKKVASKDLILPESIKEKHLFFEPSLERQLSMLRSSLDETNYGNLCSRLAAKNLPTGVCVLLYGEPGTGKTESVMQMARSTHRAVMHVDISATKTCWFGESEKLIKEVFNKYQTLCKESKIKPILLFNEADAVFSKRKDSNSSSVAQTENAIQNIILEQMEQLDGILIATTNLADNLDKAFERRFLFKIRYGRPTLEAKQNIWLDKIPTLTPENASRLAACYDFSGGEIDNIVRKATMIEVLQGNAPSLESLLQLCNEEKINGKSTVHIGFQ